MWSEMICLLLSISRNKKELYRCFEQFLGSIMAAAMVGWSRLVGHADSVLWQMHMCLFSCRIHNRWATHIGIIESREDSWFNMWTTYSSR